MEVRTGWCEEVGVRGYRRSKEGSELGMKMTGSG